MFRTFVVSKEIKNNLNIKIMKTVKANIETVSPKGNVKTFAITVNRGWELTKSTDSENGVEIENRREIMSDEIIVTVCGETYKYTSREIETRIPMKYKEMGIAAIIGKVALFEAEYDALKAALDAAKKEAETDANWQAMKEAERKADEQDARYEAHRKAMEEAMNY